MRNETPTAYFEDLWNGSPDPWAHAERWYEHRKYDVTAAALPRERYARVLEPACGVGLLTRRLASRAVRVEASDRYPESVAATSARCADLENVTVSQRDVRDRPRGTADLIVLGEVLYYFDEAAVRRIAELWQTACDTGGHLVAVHYRPEVAEHVLTGDVVHDVLRATLGAPLTSIEDPSFLLDVFAP